MNAIRFALKRTSHIAAAAAGLLAPGTLTGASAAPSFTSLFTFTYQDQGLSPIQVAKFGNALYGVTEYGGGANQGVLFKFSLQHNQETVLTNFGFGAGGYPISINGFGANLYIPTQTGSVYGYNARTGAGSTLYDVLAVGAGVVPDQILQVENNLYGLALVRGQTANLYSFDLSTSTETTLFNFTGWKEGGAPDGAVVYDHGILYGVVNTWRNYRRSGIFRYDLATGTEAVIYKFRKDVDGAGAVGLASCNGTLYVMNNGGGTNGYGTVLAYTIATGAVNTLYNFQGGTDSAAPSVPVCAGTTIYASGMRGGAYGYGTVFSIDTQSGQETILHNFDGMDGAYPVAPPSVQGNTLYGATTEGPQNGGIGFTGTLYQISQ